MGHTGEKVVTSGGGNSGDTGKETRIEEAAVCTGAASITANAAADGLWYRPLWPQQTQEQNPEHPSSSGQHTAAMPMTRVTARVAKIKSPVIRMPVI